MWYRKISVLASVLALLAVITPAQAQVTGQQTYNTSCLKCHGEGGFGGELGPAILRLIPTHTDAALLKIIREGIPGSGMPATPLSAADGATLVTYLRSLKPEAEAAVDRSGVRTTDGKQFRGTIANRGADDVQLFAEDGTTLLFRKAGDSFRQVTSQVDWTNYDGDTRGARYSKMNQINKENVGDLAGKWIYTYPMTTAPLQVTPVVIGGIMYVTGNNNVIALDAGSGRQIWRFNREQTQDLIGNARSGINRGVSASGDRIFLCTDNAHLVALDRHTGKLLWETEMADWKLNYNATSAPMCANGLVIAGTAGGDEGVRGFLAAYDEATGKEVWRFWTVPAPGEPGSETWIGEDLKHGAAVCWLTGSYDPELKTVYWPTGNPGNDLNGDFRQGDNLYSCSVIALDVTTGKLKWHYQFTPHDVHDWDATEPLSLIDSTWEGQPRKLLVQANRNGFFYVLDRVTGKFLLGKPFIKKLTWATGIDEKGRPILVPGQEPTPEGVRVGPALIGATNWYSTGYLPSTGLYYVQTLEKYDIYRKTDPPVAWEAGRGYMGGTWRGAPDDTGLRQLRAIDIKTGEVKWEIPEAKIDGWGGVLATEGGLIFFADDGGSIAAADATNGKVLWRFEVNIRNWKASPMTYMFDNKQYIAIANGSSILSFALPRKFNRIRARHAQPLQSFRSK